MMRRMGHATTRRALRSIRSRAIVVSGALVLAGAPAMAAGTSSGASAEELFQEGRKLLQEADVAAACEKFRASLDREWADGTLLALAACHEREGKAATAWSEFQRVATQSAQAGKPDVEKLAHEHMAALEKQIPTLVVTRPRIQGLQVKVDDRVIPPSDLDRPLPLDPGDRRIDASAPGYLPWSSHVTLAAGAPPTNLAVPLLEREAPPSVAPVTPAPVKSDTPPANGRRTAAFIVGGIGVASLAVGAVTGIMALNKASTVRSNCDKDSHVCKDQEGVDADSAGATLSPISTVTVVAGLAGIGAGVFLFLTSKGERTRVPSTAVLPLVSRDVGGISLSRTF